MRHPGDAVILAGDLNLTPDSAFFRAAHAAGLTDLVTTRGHTDTRTSLYAKQGRMADYLLVSADIRVAGFDVPAQPKISDHRALVLDIA